MKFQGHVVVLEKPKPKESTIIVPENIKERNEEEMVKTFSRLKVWAVGNDVTKVKKGDFVYVTPKQLSYSDRAIFDNIETFLIREADITAIY